MCFAWILELTALIGGPRWLSRNSGSLRAGRYGDLIPVGARFSSPTQTGPGAYPASTQWVPGIFPEAKVAREWR